MRYDVVTYGDPVLRRKAAPVPAVTAEIRRLAKDMLQTMYDSKGLGLAAEQVGRTECICVIDVPPSHDRIAPDSPIRENPDVAMPIVMVNPEITASRDVKAGQEGCLSFPEIFVSVRRAREITVSFTDLEGARKELTVFGLLARVVQHEVDHLNGVLLVDRMSPVQKVAQAGKLKRLKAQAKEKAAEKQARERV